MRLKILILNPHLRPRSVSVFLMHVIVRLAIDTENESLEKFICFVQKKKMLQNFSFFFTWGGFCGCVAFAPEGCQPHPKITNPRCLRPLSNLSDPRRQSISQLTDDAISDRTPVKSSFSKGER